MIRIWLASIGCVLCTLFAVAAPPEVETPYTIAYATFAPLNTGVFIANADGTQQRLLVATPHFDANPSFSPDGRWVLFSSRRHGSVDIYRVRTDGTRLERLTDYEGFDDQAVMSPDGKSVAFVSSRSGQADIWLLDLKSRRSFNLTNNPGGDYRPAWSPDGQWIAFTTDRDSEGAIKHTGSDFAPRQITQIYAMRADGSEPRRLTMGEACAGGATWSPDGKAVAFFEAAVKHWHVLSRTFPAGGVVESQIVSVEIASGGRKLLTSGPGRKLAPQWLTAQRIAYLRSETEDTPAAGRALDYWAEGIRFTDGNTGPSGVFASPHWSRDGRHMVFHRFVEEAPASIVRTHSPDPLFQLMQTGSFPTFSPDGRRLAFADSGFRLAGYAGGGKQREQSNPTRIYVVDVDGSNRRVLHADPDQTTIGAAWSPAGDHIAFGVGPVQVRPGRYGPAYIALINAEGSGFRRMTPDDGGNYQFPSWSPDGSRLVLRAAQPSSKGLSILDAAAGTLTALTPDGGLDNLPAWSPRGDVIVFTSNRDGDWEIYSIRPDGSGLTRLTNSAGNDAHAAWSPDGRWLVFGSARGGFKDEMARGGGGQGATDIFVMRPDGSDVRRLTDDAAEEGTPAFAWK